MQFPKKQTIFICTKIVPGQRETLRFTLEKGFEDQIKVDFFPKNRFEPELIFLTPCFSGLMPTRDLLQVEDVKSIQM